MLIEVDECYCLDNLDATVRKFLKSKFKPAEGQSLEDFNKDFEDEVLLEKAYRCRVMADFWEKKALGELKKNIKIVYGLTSRDKNSIIK